ncbi:DNA topoisomerase IV subunit A [Candidatus Phycosocius spiralis]|uniref:DNA topoisomerase 4 subunit A n=1 Tax=Candidatus Phycosocius spiralis TaxID=2815099 RepID=A0ABQ4PS95_9PROT|nr:DNA topoisomerase IV subunit A [Candidatus Phycosocius spiralis]GIU65877.1 DNA topoisomerase 4 subunit A [Candidatus Phycosocius spiralis]
MGDMLELDGSGGDSGNIINEPFDRALESRYLVYALSTITSRALPDVRDGLKPVQRRIIHAMGELGLDPASNFKKCAKIVGDVMGKYHPHGDSAIYDALVRLAQDFSVRYPLVDGQGNFGNIDGDSAAAYRYTEARLTAIGALLNEGVEEDAVVFRETYSQEDEEPAVLPAGYPNLLANGSMGIAVGMATSIPPHNAAELIDACLLLIEKPEADLDEIVALVPGPDFPTGGICVETREAIREAYATGKGGFRTRARWHVEDTGRGTWRVIVTQTPYQVQKSKIVEHLAELIDNKRAPLLGDVRDESAEDIRLVLEPRSRTVEPEHLMESLFKLTDLESRFSMNLNVLDARGAPRVMTLVECLKAFLEHKREVIVARANWRLRKIDARLEILEGLLVAYLNLDKVIHIIRNEEDPKAVLITTYSISDIQANAILDTRLRNLRKLEEMEIRQENKQLKAERVGLVARIESERLQWEQAGKELQQIRAIFSKDTPLGARRTTFADAPASLSLSAEAFVTREPITVILSQKGWIRALKGKVDDLSTVKYKDGDSYCLSVQAETTDRIVLFATDGRAFALAGDKLPSGRGLGEPVRLSIDLGEEHDIVAMFVPQPEGERLVAASSGYGFVVSDEECAAMRRSGKQVLNLDGRAKTAVVLPIEGDMLAVVGENRKLLVFNSDELPRMGRGKGVKLQSYKDGGLLDALTFHSADGLAWFDTSGRRHDVPDWRDYVAKRAAAGRMVPRGFSKTGKFNG